MSRNGGAHIHAHAKQRSTMQILRYAHDTRQGVHMHTLPCPAYVYFLHLEKQLEQFAKCIQRMQLLHSPQYV